MIGSHILPHRIQPVASTVETDDYGNTVRVPGTPGAEVEAFVQPQETSEDTTEGQVRETRCKVFVNPTVAVDAWSHIVWDGRRWELLGDPRRHDAPGGRHHQVLYIRRVGA